MVVSLCWPWDDLAARKNNNLQLRCSLWRDAARTVGVVEPYTFELPRGWIRWTVVKYSACEWTEWQSSTGDGSSEVAHRGQQCSFSPAEWYSQQTPAPWLRWCLPWGRCTPNFPLGWSLAVGERKGKAGTKAISSRGSHTTNILNILVKLLNTNSNMHMFDWLKQQFTVSGPTRRRLFLSTYVLKKLVNANNLTVY